MKIEDIEEAIAIECGWKRPEDPDCMLIKRGWQMPEKWWMKPDGNLAFRHDIPDYTTDLNAIHAAWKTLSHDEKMLFQNEVFLILLSGRGFQPRAQDMFSGGLLGLEAIYRCEAFLKTKGKWIE